MANPSIPQIYDRNMNRLAYLQNAMAVGYELPINSLWTASFSLPAADPKNEYCKPLNFVEIYDGDERIDLFRIIGEDLTRSDDSVTVYSCEHVLATLLNDVLFQYHQIGGTSIKTAQVINYILSYQTTERWQLSVCDFQRQFEYNFENENLLSALFAVPNCFDVDYIWSWDTTVYPWLLSLETPDDNLKSEIRYGKNMTSITRTIDHTTIANRIYALGYGEGVNQLTINSVNNDIPYVEDVISIQEYGLCPSILVDTRYEVAENLKGYAQQMLAQLKDPYVTYEVGAIDSFRLNGDNFGKFRPGDIVRVIDTDMGITLRTRIVDISKSDLRGSPGDITVTLANKSRDIAGSISDLANRARINETYAQGATNLMMQNFADNADTSYPAVMKIWIPEETVRINKIQLSVEFEPFRAYSKAVEGGGGIDETTDNNDTVVRTTSATVLEPQNMEADDSGGYGAANHNHGISSGSLLAIVNTNLDIIGYDAFVASGAHMHDAHDHEITIPRHRHDFSLPDHTHDLEFGIYEGQTASSATITVDGNTMPTVSDYSDINIVSYLDKDDSGKITRNTWHTIEIAPNRMSRIVAALFTQLFTNSRGGGDY